MPRLAHTRIQKGMSRVETEQCLQNCHVLYFRKLVEANLKSLEVNLMPICLPKDRRTGTAALTKNCRSGSLGMSELPKRGHQERHPWHAAAPAPADY